MEILLSLTVGTLCIVCFLIGAKVGQTVSREEKIELPNLNPIKLVSEIHDEFKAEKEKSRVEKIMHNIDAYDGTSLGQRDI